MRQIAKVVIVVKLVMYQQKGLVTRKPQMKYENPTPYLPIHKILLILKFLRSGSNFKVKIEVIKLRYSHRMVLSQVHMKHESPLHALTIHEIILASLHSLSDT
jgi:hypothetical protein